MIKDTSLFSTYITNFQQHQGPFHSISVPVFSQVRIIRALSHTVTYKRRALISLTLDQLYLFPKMFILLKNTQKLVTCAITASLHDHLRIR